MALARAAALEQPRAVAVEGAAQVWRQAPFDGGLEFAFRGRLAEPFEPGVRDLSPDTFDPDAPPDLAAAGPGGMDTLDSFISVVQYARTAGCSYVDGAFVPVLKS